MKRSRLLGLALLAAAGIGAAIYFATRRDDGPVGPRGRVQLAGRQIEAEIVLSAEGRRTAFADRRGRWALRPFLIGYPRNRYHHYFSKYPDLPDRSLDFPHDVRILFADLEGKVVDDQTLRARDERGVTSRAEAAWALVLPARDYQDLRVTLGERLERLGELATKTPEEMPALMFPSGEKLYVELAITDADRHRGLMHRPRMSPNDGMLFVFPKAKRQEFYMKNTLIPLALAYVSEDGTLDQFVGMDPQNPTTRPSEKMARFVIEANAGWFGEHRVMVGEKVEWPEPVRQVLDRVQ